MEPLTNKRYRVVNPPVISEYVDGEVVVINLDTGIYYSLRGAAGVAWECLRRSTALAAVATTLRSRYEAPTGVVEESLAKLVEDLLEKELLHPLDETKALFDIEESPSAPVGERLPFDGCVLECFDDMQELLAMDPIHEVDDAGWPSASKAD